MRRFQPSRNLCMALLLIYILERKRNEESRGGESQRACAAVVSHQLSNVMLNTSSVNVVLCHAQEKRSPFSWAIG